MGEDFLFVALGTIITTKKHLGKCKWPGVMLRRGKGIVCRRQGKRKSNNCVLLFGSIVCIINQLSS